MELTQRPEWNTQPNHGELVEQLLEFQEFPDQEQAEPDKEPLVINVEREECPTHWRLTEDGTEKSTSNKEDMPFAPLWLLPL